MANDIRDAVAHDQGAEAALPSPPLIGIAVEHRSRLATGVALAAAIITVAWFARALQVGEVMAWAWCVVTGAVAVVQLLVVRDSSAPLLLADDQGVRVRHGETWSGLRWQDIDHVDVTSPTSWLHDGQIVVHPRETDEEPTLSAESLTVPLAATTRLRFDGLTGDLVADLDSLASGRTPVVVVTRLVPVPDTETVASEAAEAEDTTEDTTETPGIPAEPAPVVHSAVEVVVLGGVEGADGVLLPHQVTAEERDEAEIARRLGAESVPDVGGDESDHGDQVEPAEDELGEVGPVGPVRARKADPQPSTQPVVHFAPVAPVRETRTAARSEVVRDTVRAVSAAIPAQRGIGQGPVVVVDVEDQALRQEQIDDRPRPAAEPVIGPLIAAARNRARLSIDTLSERTRIRPHVLECIEVDDFAPCGGDFYARGHLRTLARVFGLESTELLALYDEHYAHPVIEARQVFEAELATGIGGGMRATSTGPRWSVLAAAVVALGLVWGVAHVFTDKPQQIVSPAPDVDSAGLTHARPADASSAPASTLASLAVTAEGDSPQVVVRDRDGRILWAGKLAQGRRQQVIGLGPFDVTASNGKAVRVAYLGRSKGTVGPTSAADSKQFG